MRFPIRDRRFAMITFGELRRKSVEWKTEITTVEKIYARDWLVKGVVDNPVRHERVALSGAPALTSAYFAQYPRVLDIDFVKDSALTAEQLAREMENAVKETA